MSTDLTSSGPSMGTMVRPGRSIGQHPKARGVTVTRAFQQEMGLSTEAVAHKRIYLTPTIEDQACALARSYARAGAFAEGEKFLHAIQRAAKPETHRPFGTEIMVQLAAAEAAEMVARQSLSMVRCKSTALIWRQKAYRDVAELLGSIACVEREFGLNA